MKTCQFPRCRLRHGIIILSIASASALHAAPVWSNLGTGLDIFSETRLEVIDISGATITRTQQLNAIRVDLTAAVKFYVTPSNGADPEETTGESILDFVDNNGLAAAINANFYSPAGVGTSPFKDAEGLVVSDGTLVSPYDAAFANEVLLLSSGNAPTIQVSEPTAAQMADTFNAIAGSPMLLAGGLPQIYPTDTSVHARTAVGVDATKKFLFMVTIDGDDSTGFGASLFDLSERMMYLGAWDAFNLSGGSTTAMALAGPSGASLVTTTTELAKHSAIYFGVRNVHMPEPGEYVLLGLGAILFVVAVRRRQRLSNV